MGTNISIAPAVLERLAEYQKARKKNRSEMIVYALEKLFDAEEPDDRREKALERAVKRWVIIPGRTSARAFYGFLYMLSKKRPNDNAQEFWSEAMYVGSKPTTNKELFAEINRDFETIITL